MFGGLEPQVPKVCFCSDPEPVIVEVFEDPNWFSFVISDELYNEDLEASWGVLESYKSDYSEYVFKTSDKKLCILTKDETWPDLEWENNLLGFFISEED